MLRIIILLRIICRQLPYGLSITLQGLQAIVLAGAGGVGRILWLWLLASDVLRS